MEEFKLINSGKFPKEPEGRKKFGINSWPKEIPGTGKLSQKVITEHLRESDPYSEIVKVISVNILYFDLGQGEDYIYHGSTSFKGLHNHDVLQLSCEQQELYNRSDIHSIFPEYYLIKVNNFNDIAKDTLDEWIYFLKNEEIKESFKARGLLKAKHELDILKLPEEERLAYERYRDDLHYQASMVASSYGLGVKRGYRYGLEEGREQGLEEGSRQKALAIAKSLLDILDISTIALKTGLSESEIEELKGK